MIGLPGPTLRDEDVRLFRDTRAAGLILYRRNFESPAQLAALLSGLESALGRRLLETLPRKGPLAARRAPAAASHRVHLGRDARHPSASVPRRDRGRCRVRDDLTSRLPEPGPLRRASDVLAPDRGELPARPGGLPRRHRLG